MRCPLRPVVQLKGPPQARALFHGMHCRRLAMSPSGEEGVSPASPPLPTLHSYLARASLWALEKQEASPEVAQREKALDTACSKKDGLRQCGRVEQLQRRLLACPAAAPPRAAGRAALTLVPAALLPWTHLCKAVLAVGPAIQQLAGV